MYHPKPFELRESTRKNKKYDIYVPKGDSLVKVSFGDSRYNDYISYYQKDPEKAKERRVLYQIRHARDNLENPYSPGFWSMWVLWNKPTLGSSLEDAIRKSKPFLKKN